MEKFLVVKGCAGIANRLFTVTKAIEIALQQNRILLVDWTDGQFAPKGINAFTHFFDLVGLKNTSAIQYDEQMTVYPIAWKGKLYKNVYDCFYQAEPPYQFIKKIPFSRLGALRFKMLQGYWAEKGIDSTHAGFFLNIFNKNTFPDGEYYYKNRKEDVLIFVSFCPPFNPQFFFKHIRLKPQYIQKAEKFVLDNELNSDSVAVHIRFTDKKPTKKIEPFLKFLIDKSNAQKVFLSTDNLEIERRFKDKLKERLVSYPKFLTDTGGHGLHQYALYNKKESLMLRITEESLMDMWILSMCTTLYYQGNSSFSQIAKLMHSNKQLCFDWMNMSFD